MLIIGLGNPGKDYDNTRHNIGFDFLEYLKNEILKAPGDPWVEKKSWPAEIFEKKFLQQKVILLKPLTFMNSSGKAVQKALNFWKMAVPEIIVIHDDVDLKIGTFKIQSNRGSAGHNGIKSIIDCLKTQDFLRIRIGVGKEDRQKQGDTANFVLKKFTLSEKFKLRAVRQEVGAEINKFLSF